MEHGGRSAEIENLGYKLLCVKTLERFVLGDHVMHPFYKSFFPPPWDERSAIFMCDYCLHYQMSEPAYRVHYRNPDHCLVHTPPGRLLYEDESERLRVYVVDGLESKNYCQNLSLLGKSYIEKKDRVFTSHLFIFYVLAERTDFGARVVGYFSKEREPRPFRPNVACIMIAPAYQQLGYGTLLIDLSYHISRREGEEPGSPEQPLSPPGRRAYLRYWSWALRCAFSPFVERPPALKDTTRRFSIELLSRQSGMIKDDIIATIKQLDLGRWLADRKFFVSYRRLKSVLGRISKPRLLVDERRLLIT